MLHDGKCDDAIAHLRKGAREFPNAWYILIWLAARLSDRNQEGDFLEALAICERMKNCNDTEMRSQALVMIPQLLASHGEYERAKAALNDLPHWYSTYESAAKTILQGDEQREFIEHEIGQTVFDLMRDFMAYYFELDGLTLRKNTTRSSVRRKRRSC